LPLLAAAGCGKGGQGGAGGFQAPPTPVETAEVAQGAVTERFETVGTIEAADAITVVSEIPGIVVSLPFREGDHVETGTLLAQLDDSELRAAFARAEAIRSQREAAYNRVKLVVEQAAGTPQDLDDASAALKVAEADADLARERLDKTRIVAPFPGRVAAREVSPGAFVQPGTPITKLARIREIKVVFTAPERYVPKLGQGATVRISTTAYPGEYLTGTIAFVDPVLDPETRSAEVIARAANPGERILPGMSADVSAILSQRDSAMTIPPEAVFAEGDESLVYVVQPDSTVMRTPVSLGTRLEGSVEIVAGLEPGQRVVRAGHQKLYPGARIFPVSSGDAAAGAQGAGAAPESGS
jgi:membrane fusion protein (multidrug efflux system)